MEEVQVMVGTISCAWALVTSEVLMYTTCRELGTWEACRRKARYSAFSADSARLHPIFRSARR